jgi:hypothetical protein
MTPPGALRVASLARSMAQSTRPNWPYAERKIIARVRKHKPSANIRRANLKREIGGRAWPTDPWARVSGACVSIGRLCFNKVLKSSCYGHKAYRSRTAFSDSHVCCRSSNETTRSIWTLNLTKCSE